MLLLLLPFIVSAYSRTAPPTELAGIKLVEPPARCTFSVHKDGPGGEPVSGTALDVQLFYNIRCEKVEGFCLIVSNCTVSADEPGFKPYAIIDQNGCTLEPSLYEDIRYESAFSAGIINPIPIRFRGSSAAVLLYCVTTLSPAIEGQCLRPQCAH